MATNNYKTHRNARRTALNHFRCMAEQTLLRRRGSWSNLPRRLRLASELPEALNGGGLLLTRAMRRLMQNLGNVLMGQGVRRDIEKAEKSFRLAEQGIAEAQPNIETMFSVGDSVLENRSGAAKWFHLAAEQSEVVAQPNSGNDVFFRRWCFEEPVGGAEMVAFRS